MFGALDPDPCGYVALLPGAFSTQDGTVFHPGSAAACSTGQQDAASCRYLIPDLLSRSECRGITAAENANDGPRAERLHDRVPILGLRLFQTSWSYFYGDVHFVVGGDPAETWGRALKMVFEL